MVRAYKDDLRERLFGSDEIPRERFDVSRMILISMPFAIGLGIGYLALTQRTKIIIPPPPIQTQVERQVNQDSFELVNYKPRKKASYGHEIRGDYTVDDVIKGFNNTIGKKCEQPADAYTVLDSKGNSIYNRERGKYELNTGKKREVGKGDIVYFRITKGPCLTSPLNFHNSRFYTPEPLKLNKNGRKK